MPYYARRHQLENNVAYHVMNRSNARRKIFHESRDYDVFKSILYSYSQKSCVSVYHYCIMPNHYHLLIEIKEPEKLSAFMASVNRLYTVYHHKKYITSGYLWQGRFKSKAVQKDSYLLGCGRYIERNPVFCDMESCAEDYLYSSACYYVLGEKDWLVTENPLYSGFGVDIYLRRKKYKIFLSDFDEEEEKQYNNYGVPLGDSDFVSKLVKYKGTYIPRRKGKSLGQ